MMIPIVIVLCWVEHLPYLGGDGSGFCWACVFSLPRLVDIVNTTRLCKKSVDLQPNRNDADDAESWMAQWKLDDLPVQPL